MVYGTKAFLPHLLKRSKGHIVNVSSALALIGVPTQSAYNASKFAIRGFTESLQRERRRSSVSVSCVYPGGVQTNIVRDARFYKAPDGSTDRDLQIKRFDGLARTSPEEAARVILEGVKKKRARILIGGDARVIDLVQRLFPASYERVLDSFFRMRR